MSERKLSLREIQLLELDIAKEIRRICEKNNITYFLIGGTLLGAVRHKGFIPWDDDMDIGMSYSDYCRFIKIAPKELNSRFMLQHWNDGSPYAYPFSKVKLLGTTVTEKVNRNLNMNKGVWVDVFPYMPAEKEKATSSWFMFKLQLLGKICLLKQGYDLSALTKKKASKAVNFILKKAPISYKKARNCFMNKLKKTSGNTNYYIQCDGMFTGAFVFPKSYFSELIPLKFEDSEFMAPKQYHKYLSKTYGDYMKLPSIEERNGHSLLDAIIKE